MHDAKQRRRGQRGQRALINVQSVIVTRLRVLIGAVQNADCYMGAKCRPFTSLLPGRTTFSRHSIQTNSTPFSL